MFFAKQIEMSLVQNVESFVWLFCLKVQTAKSLQENFCDMHTLKMAIPLAYRHTYKGKTFTKTLIRSYYWSAYTNREREKKNCFIFCHWNFYMCTDGTRTHYPAYAQRWISPNGNTLQKIHQKSNLNDWIWASQSFRVCMRKGRKKDAWIFFFQTLENRSLFFYYRNLKPYDSLCISSEKNKKDERK